MKWEKTFLYSRGYEDHYKITCPNCGHNEEVIMVEGKIEREVVYCKKCGATRTESYNPNINGATR